MRSTFARPVLSRLCLAGALLALAAPAAAQVTLEDVARGTAENYAKRTRPVRSYTVEHETMGVRGTVHVELDAADAANPPRIFVTPAGDGGFGGAMATYADFFIYLPRAIAEAPAELMGAELVGVRPVEGRSAFAVRMDLSEDGSGGQVGVLYLDSADYRPVRVEFEGLFEQAPGSALVVDLADYREVDGFPIPFRRSIRVSDALALFGIGTAEEALAAVAQGRARLDQLPAGQRAQVEPALAILEEVARTGSFALSTTVLSARVNAPRPEGLVAADF